MKIGALPALMSCGGCLQPSSRNKPICLCLRDEGPLFFTEYGKGEEDLLCAPAGHAGREGSGELAVRIWKRDLQNLPILIFYIFFQLNILKKMYDCYIINPTV